MKANVFILIATVIAQLIVALVTWLTTTKQGRKAWADFCDAMQRTGQAMADWFKKAFNDLKSFFKTTWDDITGFFRSAGTNISNIWNNVVDFFKAIPGRIKDFFSDAGSWLLNAGRNVVDGLINGIESKFAAIGNVVSSMASKITGGFKSLLGINSPSKVFSGFGQNVGEGFINGVTSKISNAQAAVKRLVTLPTTQSMGLSGLQLAGVTSAASKAGTSGNVIIGTLNAGNKTTNEIMSGLNGLARGRGQS
jgi:phage-related minor tail protein